MNTTRQELFNMAYKGLEAQGWKQSADSGGRCLYRGPDGLKCAVGHCIPDEDYDSDFDNKLFNLSSIIRILGVETHNYTFLADLQRSHDGAQSPEQMKERFIGTAAIYGLEVPA